MKLLAAFEVDAAPVALSFLPNCEALLVGTNLISVYTLPSLEKRTLIDPNLDRFTGFALHPQSNLIAVYGSGRYGSDYDYSAVKILSLPDGKVLSEYPQLRTEWFSGAAFSPDGTRLLIGSQREILWIIHLNSGLIEFGCYSGDATSSISFHPDGQTMLFTPCWQEGVKICFAELTGHLVRNSSRDLSFSDYCSVTPASFSPDGRHFAFADRLVRLYDYPACKRIFCFDAQGRAFNPTKQDEKREQAKLKTQANSSYAYGWSNCVFSHDSQMLICDSPDSRIYFWDVKTGAILHILPGHTGYFRRLCVSLDGQFLASTGEDKIIRLWQLTD